VFEDGVIIPMRFAATIAHEDTGGRPYWPRL
jgi:hypothetical protein